MRPFADLKGLPPWPRERFTTVQLHNLSDERRVLWQTIEAPVTIKSIGRMLWSSTMDFKRYWPEFRSFIAQARLYDDAANALSGASGALLAYYSALNLAKAELLVSDPTKVYQQTINHGLGYKPSQRSIRAEFVRTQDGVFPLLYRARTGLTLANKVQLPVLLLLGNLSDVAHELSQSGLGQGAVSPIVHYVVVRDQYLQPDVANEAWSLIGFPDLEVPSVLSSTSTRRFLGDHFQLVENGSSYLSDWLVFGPSPRHLLQSKHVHSFDATTADTVFNDVVSRTAAIVRPVQGHLTYSCDEWVPSLRKSSWLPMPPDLARYAAMFYCSSVARYRPSLLHADAQGEASWILNTFVMEARLLLLRSAVEGITGRHLELHQASRS